MEDKILKQIEDEAGRIINEMPYKMDGLDKFYGHQTITNKFIEAATFGYNIKESVDVDWKKLRDEYFDEHLRLDTGCYIHITTSAHDLFEWFKLKLSASKNTVSNEGLPHLDEFMKVTAKDKPIRNRK